MALVRCEFFSEVLELSTSMTVLLPERATGQIGLTGSARASDPPVLYLLHGLSDDDSTWLRRTSIERYAAPLGLAVVMPQVHRSFYTDEVHGSRFWTFVSQELPELVHRFFRLSREREDTFVAGLSMGGYGALKLALRHPERFAAAASLSGALDVADPGFRARRADLSDRVFGARGPAGTDDDLFALLDAVGAAALPALAVHCGEQDALVGANRRFADSAARAGVALTTSFSPGAHEWGYWDAAVQDVLAWLPLR